MAESKKLSLEDSIGNINKILFDEVGMDWDAVNYLMAGGRRGGKQYVMDRKTGTFNMKLEDGVWIKIID